VFLLLKDDFVLLTKYLGQVFLVFFDLFEPLVIGLCVNLDLSVHLLEMFEFLLLLQVVVADFIESFS
jgi:hypothetical protein